MQDRIGSVAPELLADLLVVDGDPLADISLLTRPTCLRMVMKGGRIYRDRLAAV